MKKHLLPIFLLAITAIFCCGIFVCSADDGDYIEIWTAEDLYNIRDNLSGNYKLMKDLDLTNETAIGGI